MKDTMEYKGYKAKIAFDAEDESFHGTVVNVEDTIHFEGKSVAELRKELKESVEFYLGMCKKRGESPEKPFSGKVLVRLAPELHREAAYAAKLSGSSVNAFIAKAVTDATKRATH